MCGYIYMTTSLVNGKRYIGQKTSQEFLGSRYLGSGKELKRATSQYGKDAFKVELIEECETFEELNEREDYWISYYNASVSEDFYNQYKTVHPNFRGHRQSEETKQRLHSQFYGENSPTYGRKVKEETRDKMKESKKGITWINNGSEVRMHKICNSVPEGWVIGRLDRKSGREHYSYGRIWIYNEISRETRLVNPDEEVPEGWKKGNISARGRKYINNGEVVKAIPKDDPVPEGWSLGRRLSSSTTIESVNGKKGSIE